MDASCFYCHITKLACESQIKMWLTFFHVDFCATQFQLTAKLITGKKFFSRDLCAGLDHFFFVMVSIAQHNSVRSSPLKHNLLYPANYLAFTDRMSPCAGKTIPFYLSLYMEIERSVNALFRLRAPVETICIDGNKVWFGFLSCWGINSQNQLEKMQRGN